MTDKCDKYESLFTFATDEEFANHLEICEDCRKEHEKMQKTENLIKEIKPFYKDSAKNNKPQNLLKIAAAIMVAFLAYFSINQFNQPSFYKPDLAQLEKESVVSQMGLPTDEYGLLMIY